MTEGGGLVETRRTDLTDKLDELKCRVVEGQVRAGKVGEVFRRVATARRRHLCGNLLRDSENL